MFTQFHAHTAGTINQGPSNVTFISGRTSLPIVLTCNVTGFASWIVNGTPYFTSQLLAGLVDGHSANEADIVINIPMNDTEYICVSNTQSAAVNSSSAFLYIAGKFVHCLTLYTYVCTHVRLKRACYVHTLID